jgi:FKBP-type peptidyl-prolyl cis-trans isomerase 2
MRTRVAILGWALMGIVLSLPAAALSAEAAPSQPQPTGAVAPGYQVSLEYTLSDDKGAQIQTNKGEAPLVYTPGKQEILPGLERALDGMHVGEEKDVKLPPEEAYGPIDKEAFQEVPKSSIPAEGLKVGAPLRARSPDGRSMLARVSEIKDKTVVVDLNHPLAGKTLAFHVKILDVKKVDEKARATSKAPQAPAAAGANAGATDKSGAVSGP